MKRLTSVLINIIICTMLFFFNTCKSEKTAQIGFLLPNLVDLRYLKDRDFFVESVAQQAEKVDVYNASNDANLQETQAQQLIESGCKVIVITAVNQFVAASIVRLANKKGVRVIAYERLIQNCKLDYLVTYDHLLVGKQQASYAVKHQSKGNYVIIGGDKSDKNAELIYKGQQEIISDEVKQGNIIIVYQSFIEDWSSENAFMEMKRALKLSGKKIDVVLVANDGMAGGVVKALEEIQPGYPVIVTGLDADLAACRRIIKGTQTITVYKSFKNQGKMAADLAIKLLQGIKISECSSNTFNGSVEVPTILLQPTVVDSLNIKEIIVDGGFYKYGELF